MVMDVYQTIVPVPPESVYLLEKQIRDFDVVMGATAVVRNPDVYT